MPRKHLQCGVGEREKNVFPRKAGRLSLIRLGLAPRIQHRPQAHHTSLFGSSRKTLISYRRIASGIRIQLSCSPKVTPRSASPFPRIAITGETFNPALPGAMPVKGHKIRSLSQGDAPGACGSVDMEE
jgi:hypothetical protein